jgi:hypothetical protein
LCLAEGNICYPPKIFSIGYSSLTVLGLFFIHTVFFTPQCENLSYCDFKSSGYLHEDRLSELPTVFAAEEAYICARTVRM